MLLFFCVWIIFNGTITAEIAVIGAVIVLFMFAFICRFMDYSLNIFISLMRRSVSFLYYTGVLIVEIIKSNLQVMHLTLTDREIVEPVIISYRTRLRSKLCRVILANSITLTPGTITISLEEDELVIHCLDKTIAEGIENSTFEQLLERMEKQ